MRVFHLVDRWFTQDSPCACARGDEERRDAPPPQQKNILYPKKITKSAARKTSPDFQTEKSHPDVFLFISSHLIQTPCVHMSSVCVYVCVWWGFSVTHGFIPSAPDSATVTELLSGRTPSIVISLAKLGIDWTARPQQCPNSVQSRCCGGDETMQVSIPTQPNLKKK